MSEHRTVRLRRSPKVGVFLGLGVLLGVLVAAVIALVTPPEPQYPTAQVFGYVLLLLAPVGAVLGGMLAVVLDAVASRRARLVTAERATGREPEDGTP